MKIELKNISKTFGKVCANQNINLHVPSGTIQGVLGENGAGKSTLMKILSGFISYDTGQLLVDDQPILIQSPADAVTAGIGMLHQDPLDVPQLSVLDNFIMQQNGKFIPNRKKAKKELIHLTEKFNFQINPDAQMESLTVGQRQQLEILRLISLGVKILILDEPTTGISLNQKQQLFAALKTLSQEGHTIFFVSHKLEEVAALCDQVVVLRKGQVVAQLKPPYDINNFVKYMFGTIIELPKQKKYATPDNCLKADRVGIETHRLNIKNVDLDLKQGEVIGLAGMAGSGQEVFMQACAGLTKAVAGTLELDGVDLTKKSYRTYKESGVAYVPASRLEDAMFSGMTLKEHFILANQNKHGIISSEKAHQQTQNGIQKYNVKGTPEDTVDSLSGGNQQRALLAMLAEQLNVIILDNPTRGLDVESSIWIWKQLKERCKKDNTSILFYSADLDEVLEYSDRVMVFYNGEATQPVDKNNINVETLGNMIGGAIHAYS
jgi:simple sugar transport system ATP-binding protein